MLQTVKHPHYGGRIFGFTINGTGGGAPSIVSGGAQVSSIVRNGVGDYSVYFRRKFAYNETASASNLDTIAIPIGFGDGGGATSVWVVNSDREHVRLARSGDGPISCLVFGWDSFSKALVESKTQRQKIQTPERATRLLAIKVTNTASTPTASIGGNQVTVVKNGTSDFTVVFNRPFQELPIVVGSAYDGIIYQHSLAYLTVNSVRFLTLTPAGAAADKDFTLFVLGSDGINPASSLHREVKAPFRQPYLRAFRSSDSGTATMRLGASEVSVVDAGTGLYTYTYTPYWEEEPVVVISAGNGGALSSNTLQSTSRIAVATKSYNSAGSGSLNMDVAGLALGSFVAGDL